MATEHNFTSSLELSSEESNRQHIEAVRQFAAAPQFGPAAVDQNENVRRVRPLPVEPVWSAAKYTVSPSLDERVITSIKDFDEGDPALAQARNAFSTATETLKQLSTAREPLSRDSSKTDEQRLLLMATHAEKAQDRVARVFDNAFKSLTKAANEIERQLTAPLEQSTHSELCKEIRGHIKLLDKDERTKFISEAFMNGDKDVMNAVLGVPSYLCGISDAHRALWLRQYREQKDPAAVVRLRNYRTAVDLITERSQLIFPEFEKAQGGKWKDVRRLRGQVEASDKALAGLSGE
jgi:hypothetical protein